MKPLHKGILAVSLAVIGAPMALVGLIRLGWRRHGTGPFDPSFLHPSWAFQPTLPFWSAHLCNLGCLLAGVIGLGSAVFLLASLVVAKVRSRDESSR